VGIERGRFDEERKGRKEDLMTRREEEINLKRE
jgi:hypothetical protein